MKVMKLSLFILLLLLVIPFVTASLTIDPFYSSKHNLGDGILVSGTVIHSNTTRANLNLFLNCNSANAQIAAMLLDLRANQAVRYSRYVVLPTSLVGNCSVFANLVDPNGLLLETQQVPAFEVTDQLKGSLDINGEDFQLGDKLEIKGIVTKQNNAPADGVIMISFEHGDATLFFDNIEIIDGAINYSKVLERIPTGEYLVSIFIRDNFGNVKDFSRLFDLNVSGNMNIHTSLDRTLYSPGDTILLNGYVSSNFNKLLKNIHLDFDFENAVRTRTLATSADTFTLNEIINSKIRSGSHDILVVANDEQGNYGSQVVKFDVRAIPTKLTISLDENSYNPGDTVSFMPILTDQASDEMQESVKAYLLDVDGDIVDSKIVLTGPSDSFVLPKQAQPGYWKVKVEGYGLENDVAFSVRQYPKLNASVIGKSLVVENIGNVPYKGILSIVANEFNKTKNVDLDVGEVDEINLDDLFPPGLYDVTVPVAGRTFTNVIIPEEESIFDGFSDFTGNVAKNVDSGRAFPLFIAIVLLCVGLIILIVAKRRGRQGKMDFSKDTDYKLGQKKLDELRAKGIRKDKPVEYGRATKEDVEDWKRRVQESFKEQERKKGENEFVRHQQDNMRNDRPRSGMFNMFG